MTEQLKPGQHGKIFVYEKGAKWKGQSLLRLLDGSYTTVTRVRRTETSARLAVQDGITERLGAAQGSIDLKPNSKVGQACRQWVNEMRARTRWPNPPVLPQTVDEYERLLGNHVVPRLGKRRLNELTPAVCQGWLDGILERGRAGGKHDMLATAIQARSAFVAVMDRAVVHDAVRDNPVRKTLAPSKKKPEPRSMTAIDVHRLRMAVRDWEEVRKGQPGPKPTGHLPAAVDVMLGTGMRIGEVMALRWGEVNLSPDGLPTITVAATMVDIKGQGTVRQPQPKSEAGERIIVVPPFTAQALASIRPSGETTAEMPVFPSRTFRDGRNVGRSQTPANMRRSLRLALERAKMTGEVYPHLLRKTVATFVARKLGAGDAAMLLGHKIDAGVTGRHYIERLRLAPDSSAVLQAMVEIGAEEAAKADQAAHTQASVASLSPAGDLTPTAAWVQPTLTDDETGW